MKFLRALLLPLIVVAILMSACEKPDYTKNQYDTAKAKPEKPKPGPGTDTTKTDSVDAPITNCFLPYLTNLSKDSAGSGFNYEFWKMTARTAVPAGAEFEECMTYDSAGADCDIVVFVHQSANTSGKVPAVDIGVPSAFSPNGDGFNDDYQVIATGQTRRFFVSIKNMLGEEVYTSDDPDESWDGTVDGEAEDQGQYTVTITITYFTTNQNYFYRYNHTGTFILNR